MTGKKSQFRPTKSETKLDCTDRAAKAILEEERRERAEKMRVLRSSRLRKEAAEKKPPR